ncbi:MAG: hypothetical protein U5M23_11625 [Marinagarivorans sp.]|nr:hypothetical protein [Marinagarivorans sp.]
MMFIWLMLVAMMPLSADPRDDLQFLQQIQGGWQRHCYPSVDGNTRVYREDDLVISYTHFQFASRIYLDDTCSAERTSYSGKIRYALEGGYMPYLQDLSGGAAALPRRAYALNFSPDDALPVILQIPSRNIIAQGGLELFLGRDDGGESSPSDRLTKLDIPSPYVRH